MTKELYNFQLLAVEALLDSNKHILYATTGSGKNPISVVWAARKALRAGKTKILVISTPSKIKTKDHLQDFKDFCPGTQHISLELVSWYQLHKWIDAHRHDLNDYVIIADEVHKMKAGVSSRMGRSFLKLVKSNPNWCGFTATPGDKWVDLYAYFQAAGFVKNKTDFLRRFCVIQTFKGFPEITGYRDEDLLKVWWTALSYAPNTDSVMRELPPETHKVIHFPKPKSYAKILKTRNTLEGEPIETPGKLVAELRRVCFTKNKQEWLADSLDGLGEPCIVFYHYTSTGDAIEKLAKKVLPKDAKIWRIDGAHHEIPTSETIGRRDLVLTQWQSGSEALNFQYLSTWISAELTYSYTTAFQARGRIKRIGQERPMFFYYLQTEHTIEEDIMKALHDKSDFATSVWALGNGIIKDIKDYKE